MLGNDGKIYRIVFNTRYYESDKFEPTVTPTVILDDLPFQEDIPGGGSFLDAARKKFLSALFPAVTAMDVRANKIWIAGASQIYVLSINFALQTTITLPDEEILDLTCVNNDAIVVTRTQKVVYISLSGATNVLYTGSAIGSPAALADGARVAVPDSNNQRLLIFTGNNPSYAIWNTPDFVPAYCRLFDGYLHVTGHNTNVVLQYYADDLYNTIGFEDKVTLVSSVNGNMLATHYLGPAVTLNLTGIQKIVPFSLEPRTGPVTHIGTELRRIVMLGQEGIYPKLGTGLRYWANGIGDAPVNSNDYFTVSYKATNNGVFRSPVILGETAIDYTVTVISSTFLRDYLLPGTVALNRVAPPVGFYELPDSGDIDEGFTLVPLPFNLKSYGNIFGNLYVHTNGTITFENTPVQMDPTFGSLQTDAVYVEPKNLYQGKPINNVNPLNIVNGNLETYETPGVYFQDQSLGEFVGKRIRWVGTSWDSYPLGNTVNTVITTTNWPEVVLPNLANVRVGDYISGNNITVSSYVTATEFFNVNATVYMAETVPNYMLLLTNTAIKKYANVLVNNVQVGFVDTVTSTTVSGNAILAVTGNVFTIDGITSNSVDTTWAFYTSAGVGGAASIVRTPYSITPLANSGGVTVRISSADYAAIWVKQTVSGSGVPSGAAVASLYTLPRQYVWTANSIVIVEGNTVQFTLTATEVPLSDGETFNYAITGTVDSSDFVAGTGMTGSITAVNGAAVLTLTTEPNVAYEGTETITVSVQAESGVSLARTIAVIDEGIPTNTPTSVSAASALFRNYYFNSNASISATAGVPLTVEKTVIDFGTNPPPVSTTISYQYNRANLYNGTGATITSYTPVKFMGNYATVTNNQTLTADTAVLFKSNVLAPAYTYEVGVYTGGRFQYIEFWYDNTRHNSTANVGISGADVIYDSANISGIAAGTSYLFGSEIIDGRWVALGSGSFTKDTQGFTARYVDVIKSLAESDTETAYEFVVDQRIPPLVNIKLAADYGRLYLNDRVYTGLDDVVSGDRVKLQIPLGTTQRPIAPMFSIGDYQQVIPTVKDSLASTYSTTANVYVDQPPITYANSNVVITTSGLYYIPDYYRSTDIETGISQTFTRVSGGISTVLSGQYHNFVVGDRIMITNQFTSRRIYDAREVAIIGPHWYLNTLLTAPGPKFNDMNYLPLVNPFVRLRNMNQTGTQIFEEPAYRSANLTLTATVPALTSALLVDRIGVNLVINGTTVGPYVSSVSTGAKIALEWLVPNYYQQDAILYQIKTDVDGGNVRIPVGRWSINNRSISGPALISNPTWMYRQLSAATTNVTIITKSMTAERGHAATDLYSDISSQFVEQFNRLRSNIAFEAMSTGTLIRSDDVQANIANEYSLVNGFIGVSNTLSRFTVYFSNVLLGQGETSDITYLVNQASRGNVLPGKFEVESNQLVGNLLIRPHGDMQSPTRTAANQVTHTEFQGLIASGETLPGTEFYRFNDEVNVLQAATNFAQDNGFIYQNISTNLVSTISSQEFKYDVIEGNTAPAPDFMFTNVLETPIYEFTMTVDPLEVQMAPEIISPVPSIEKQFDPLVPEVKPQILKEFDPLMPEVKPQILKEFEPLMQPQVDPILKILSPVFYLNERMTLQFPALIMPRANHLTIFNQPVHYQDVLWEMDQFTQVGATYTYIGAFAPYGRARDSITGRGNPPSKLPFVFYERTYLYNKGSYSQQYIAAFFAGKYVSATAFQITGTAYWNYRIHFNTTTMLTARTGYLWPSEWLIRGG